MREIPLTLPGIGMIHRTRFVIGTGRGIFACRPDGSQHPQGRGYFACRRNFVFDPGGVAVPRQAETCSVDRAGNLRSAGGSLIPWIARSRGDLALY